MIDKDSINKIADRQWNTVWEYRTVEVDLLRDIGLLLVEIRDSLEPIDDPDIDTSNIALPSP